MAKRTRQQFVDEIFKINPSIRILNEYCGVNKKVKCKCISCNHEWDVLPRYLLQGSGCPKCRRHGRKMKTHSEFVSELFAENELIECIDTYRGAKESIWFRCKVCNHQWKTKPYYIVNNHTGCPNCARKKTHEEFVAEMHSVNPNIAIIGKYVTSNIDIQCNCLICGCSWNAKPYNLLSGTGCPHCNMSHGEKRIAKYLNGHSISYIPQHSFSELIGVGGGLLSYDFYLPECNTLIEYQGEFHDHTDRLRDEDAFNKQQIHDERKRKYAELHNIKLLEIWYYEFDDIEKILENQLMR